ncbi:transglutaminase-like domain-containing protein [Paenibacillus pasadenensis]|uniref:transglutaminase-like domain-containing protein n=1 Tax=Paenibacillus pasadenensis TaxID=217090 RepID=UPI00203FC24B|nr:transglutaminase-like domain-containing protein [Paenibacillus pasadenensis]MCM3748230.1 transglutaminase-like domain-containing protein [Paenibacillus pasadenensis]
MDNTGWLQTLLNLEPVTLIVLLMILFSFVQGLRRGARGSSQRLFSFLWEGLLLIVSLAGAARLAQLASEPAAEWLRKRIILPSHELGAPEQAWYTFLTSVRDLPLLRAGVLFLLAYLLLRLLLSALTPLAWRLFAALSRPRRDEEAEEEAYRRFNERQYRDGPYDSRGHVRAHEPNGRYDRRYESLYDNRYGYGEEEEEYGYEEEERPRRFRRGGGRLASHAAGAVLGGLHGIGRAIVLLAVLFLYVSLFPTAPLAAGIESSPVYRQAADKLLEPVAGGLLEGGGPVITEAVGSELQQVMQRKYEIVDNHIPEEIDKAAQKIVEGADSDRERAKRLYDWLGTRIAYDWDKADNYTERGVWKEQTPQETFRSRKGVCIDTSRLYAVMARSVGLEVKIVTGLGADGRGGFGSHAWNQVKLADENGKWIKLDATWASSGAWFDSPDFDKTHIEQA